MVVVAGGLYRHGTTQNNKNFKLQTAHLKAKTITIQITFSPSFKVSLAHLPFARYLLNGKNTLGGCEMVWKCTISFCHYRCVPVINRSGGKIDVNTLIARKNLTDNLLLVMQAFFSKTGCNVQSSKKKNSRKTASLFSATIIN